MKVNNKGNAQFTKVWTTVIMVLLWVQKNISLEIKKTRPLILWMKTRFLSSELPGNTRYIRS